MKGCLHRHLHVSAANDFKLSGAGSSVHATHRACRDIFSDLGFQGWSTSKEQVMLCELSLQEDDLQ